jgi:hypothetical protein
MPAKSKSQQRFMGMVHAVQTGELNPSDVSKSVVDAAKNMKKDDVKDFAETKHKGLPEEKKKIKYPPPPEGDSRGQKLAGLLDPIQETLANDI